MVALLITFFSLLWMGFVSEAHARKLPALFVLGLPVAVAQLSIAAGRSLGYLPAGTAIGSSDARLVAFVLWGLLLSLCLLYGAVLLGRRSARGQGAPCAQGPTCPPVAQGQQTPHAATRPGTQPSTPASVPAPSHPDALDLLRERFGLSAKEAQTVSEYSSGRSARYLADQAIDLGAHGQDLPAARLRQARRPLAPGAARPHGRTAKRGLLRQLLHRRARSGEAPAILERSSSRVGTGDAAEHHGV